ncbi:transcriptional repressor [Mortierella sp. GBA35]|nr:transcriptional repressor [Mortierella sp. GBA35]
MSSASTLPALSSPSHPHSLHNTVDTVNNVPRPARVPSQPQSPSLESMDGIDVDMAMHQQSKRMAGLSITNATGAKVSILNDSSAELEPSSGRSSVSQSPGLPNSLHDTHDTQDTYPPPPTLYEEYQQHQQKLPHRQRSQENHYETTRSSSLTNASTPIYSAEELASSKSSLSSASSTTLTPGSQRSRSLSGSSKLSPIISSSAGPATPTSTFNPFFTRAYSEDGSSDDPSSCRRMSDPAGDTDPNGVVKRKYSCSHPGCNNGHLARHNRIHTGERNFACLMPGCPSKFSRQDNMMQHYRTHISPKSRRGMPKKHDHSHAQFAHGYGANGSQEVLALSSREQSPAMHLAKMNPSRQGSRQNSPPRFSPFDRSNSVDYPSGRSSSESHGAGGVLRHKNSGILQTHQHHTPLPHSNVHALLMAHQHGQSGQGAPAQTSIPPGHPLGYQHQSAYVSHSHLTSSKYAVDTSRHPHRSNAALASPTSPMMQDVERMEGVAPSLDQDRPYHHHNQYPEAQQQQPSSGHYHHQYPLQKHYHRRSTSPQAHAGHAQGHNDYQLPPLSHHNQERHASERGSGQYHYAPMPPSPQSTPQTPTTKHRFDPIHDCLQQEKYQQREHGEQREQQHDGHARYHPHSLNGSQDDEDSSTTTTARSSIISHKSSMTSLSSVGSGRVSGYGSHSYQQQQQQHQQLAQGQSESKQETELSGLAHLAQIVTTYG